MSEPEIEKQVERSAKDLVVNVTGLAGLSMVGAGLWWVYPPAALIVVGGLLLAGSVWGAIR